MEPPTTSSAFRVLVRSPSSSSSTSATKAPPVAPHTIHEDVPPSSPSPPPSASVKISSSAAAAPPQPAPEGVVVVGFVGCGIGDGLAHVINLVLDADVFGSGGLDTDLRSEGYEFGNWFRHRRISYYHEREKGIVFLQFSSSPVMSLLGSGPADYEGGNNRLESFVEQHDSDDLRGLLLMFSVCHVIIFLHEGTRLDTNLLKKFRMLQGAKHALAPFIRSHVMPTAAHKSSTVPAKPTVQMKSSPSSGRAGSSRHGSAISLMSGSSSHPSVLPGQCVPVVLFVFLDDSLDGPSYVEDLPDHSSISQPSYVAAAPRTGLSLKGSTSSSIMMLSRPMTKSDVNIRKKLQTSLETQIRFLIKRSRILSGIELGHPSSRGAGNAYSLPLFSLDASKVVILLDRTTILGGESLNFITNLISQVLSSKGTLEMLESDAQNSSNEEIQSIKDFISRQSDVLRGRASITCASTSSVAGVGMVAAAAAAAAASAASGKMLCVPELPSLENWLSRSSLILNDLIYVKHNLVGESGSTKKVGIQKTAMIAQDEGLLVKANNAREAAISWLENTKGMNMTFSMSWCQKMLPVAKEIYLKDLPACYPTALHKAQLEKALNAFHGMVKGPAVQIFAKKLEEECTSIWETGRQLCDAISLTGNPCIHQRHHVKDGASHPGKVRKHSSGFVSLHACSCGRSRHVQDDPFDFESANVTFSCFPNCEGLLPRFVMPVEGKIGPIHASSWNLIRLGGARYYDPSKGLLQNGFCSNENLLLKWTISLDRCKAVGIDTVQSIPSCKEKKIEVVEEMDEANSRTGRSESDERESSKAMQTETTINFGKGLPSFSMKKAFSEVVAGTAPLDSKLSLVQQKNQPKIPAEKVVKHRTEDDSICNKVHKTNGGQEMGSGNASIQQGLQNSFVADPFLQIGSNVVPVNMDCSQKKKHKGFMNQVNVYIGFEHECSHGHRFLLSTEHLKELNSSDTFSELAYAPDNSSGIFAEKSTDTNIIKDGPLKKSNTSGVKMSPATSVRKKNMMIEELATSSPHCVDNEIDLHVCKENLKENCFPVRLDDGSPAFSLLNRDLPLYMKCPHCMSSKNGENKFKFASEVSQLRRIFLVTPPFPFVLAMRPVVQFENSILPSVLYHEQHFQFRPGCPIILPPESFLAFCLPFIYGMQMDDGSLMPLHHLKSQPELTARLVKGTTLQLMSKEFKIIDDFNMK